MDDAEEDGQDGFLEEEGRSLIFLLLLFLVARACFWQLLSISLLS